MSVGKPMLQVGSNLFELIEFTLTQDGMPAPVQRPGQPDRAPPTVYGVNVAKVREVIRLPEIVPCLSSCPEVLGVFNLRGMPIPAIHLARALGFPDEPVLPSAQLIVTEFSRRVAGFIVSSARRIRRVSWDRVLPPSSEAFNAITGMMLVENSEFIFILDFERLLIDIEMRSGAGAGGLFGANAGTGQGMVPPGALQPAHGALNVSSFDHDDLLADPRGRADGAAPSIPGEGSRPSARETDARGQPIAIVVDDSATARRAVCEILRTLNLSVVEYTNGEQAWQGLSNGGLDLRNVVIISDVEMPRLDGYSLVKRLRGDARYQAIPVILHSSLTGDVNRERAKAAGADAYVSKFNHREIVDAVRGALSGGAPSRKAVS